MKGLLTKMRVSFGEPIQYQLILNNEPQIAMNGLIGREIELSWTGRIVCSNCSKQTKNSFGQGFCFKCFQSAPEASVALLPHDPIARAMAANPMMNVFFFMIYLL